MTKHAAHIPGVSFSWRRAIGLSGLESKISRETGVPLTRSGREKKVGTWVIHGIGWLIMVAVPFGALFLLMTGKI
jgi:hypothetical protein